MMNRIPRGMPMPMPMPGQYSSGASVHESGIDGIGVMTLPDTGKPLSLSELADILKQHGSKYPYSDIARMLLMKKGMMTAKEVIDNMRLWAGVV